MFNVIMHSWDDHGWNVSFSGRGDEVASWEAFQTHECTIVDSKGGRCFQKWRYQQEGENKMSNELVWIFFWESHLCSIHNIDKIFFMFRDIQRQISNNMSIQKVFMRLIVDVVHINGLPVLVSTKLGAKNLLRTVLFIFNEEPGLWMVPKMVLSFLNVLG